MKNKRLYRIWGNMRGRCNNPKNKAYERYGGRGITVCEEWSNYETFQTWALSNGYRGDLTLDRTNNNGNYEPNNCRWVDYKTQNRNRRDNRYITYNGETLQLGDFADKYGLPYKIVAGRFDRGRTAEEILALPPQNRKIRKYVYDGKEVTLLELSKIFGISKSTLKTRVRKGYSFDDLISPIGDIARKNILKIDPITKEIVGKYKGSKDAALSVNKTSRSGIIGCCNGKHKTAHGFIWRYETVD